MASSDSVGASLNINQSKDSDVVDNEEAEFEDSLNLSISEHISEEIESNGNATSAEDSIEKAHKLFNPLTDDRKRKLFDIDDDNDDDNGNGDNQNDGVSNTRFDQFDINNADLDTILSGKNIAQHFKIDTNANDTNIETSGSVASLGNSLSSKIDVHKSISGNDDGGVTRNWSIGSVQSAVEVKHSSFDQNEDSAEPSECGTAQHGRQSEHIDKNQEASEAIENEEIDILEQETASKVEHADELDDVILINDQEISIHTLERLQSQPLHSENDRSPAVLTDQNTTSDISDIRNEDNPTTPTKEEGSREDLSSSKSRSQSHSRSASNLLQPSKEASSSQAKEATVERSPSLNNQSDPPQSDATLSNGNEHNDEGHEASDKQKKDSTIETISIDEEITADGVFVESEADKQLQMEEIIVDVVNRLPIKKSAPAIDNGLTATLETELNINLAHMQNRIKELQCITSGRYNVAAILGISSNSTGSRRNSLKDGKDSLKDLPQSGRDSITTNSTEYRTFQEEYLRVSSNSLRLGCK